MADNIIHLKTITELLGENFYIPEYQRGYRWTRTNVLQLLNDIWEYRQEPSNRNSFYCLQPIVVRQTNWLDLDGHVIQGYELIDGQQRLTTLHRIITYLMLEYLQTDLKTEGYPDHLFSIYYKTRLASKVFLESNGYSNDAPDLYYMSEAYLCLKEWFEDGKKGIARHIKEEMLKILLPGILMDAQRERRLPEWSVQVIWYEINDSNQLSEALFTRLNRGKIPLTSAELIKAKFVNADSFKGIAADDKIKRRTQLIQIWDEIENQLNNPKFWAFVSNENIQQYSNKIEYLFNIATGKKPGELDPLFSFLHFFEEKETAESLWVKWLRIEEIYRSLVHWYSNKELYHKIGYLIATGTTIGQLVGLKKDHTKLSFVAELDKLIAQGIPDDWQELSYIRPSDHGKMINVLLLINIELVRKNKNSIEFFPFEVYKGITKSLEHIHAQNIEGVDPNKRDQWIHWLNAHSGILLNITNDREKAKEVIQELEVIKPKITYQDFEQLSDRILKLIPCDETDENEYLHKIQNMALLGSSENSSLSNSVFEVKRRRIMEMDKNGAFIPLATKRVFLKYYANETAQHYSIWTANEREEYLNEIQECLKIYAPVNEENDAK